MHLTRNQHKQRRYGFGVRATIIAKGYNGDDSWYVLWFPTSRERLRENMLEMQVKGHLQECFEERNM